MTSHDDHFIAQAVGRMAALLASDATSMHAKAALRRFDPASRISDAAFELGALLGRCDVHASPGTTAYESWALIAHCLALARGAHQRSVPAGRALVAVNVSELRVRALLEAGRPMLFDLLPRLARRMAAAGQPMDWVPMARLIVSEGFDDAAAERARLDIADSYQRAAAAAADT